MIENDRSCPGTLFGEINNPGLRVLPVNYTVSPLFLSDLERPVTLSNNSHRTVSHRPHHPHPRPSFLFFRKHKLCPHGGDYKDIARNHNIYYDSVHNEKSHNATVYLRPDNLGSRTLRQSYNNYSDSYTGSTTSFVQNEAL
ncbi:hypothetical protein LshimejAT787_1402970 [Lyophyllum shimeji]|uniref:Uncharacterized protein n=1 Tax=Lyophyllum shimeji TaxID=47721 RepID=A0A9P3PVM8_LYOSH|nr:hypothetical protein LshimejAT787_1402970 [Lyophyllum shimeji]